MYYAMPSIASQTILVLGDSLSAAHGLKAEQGWVSLLADKLQSDGSDDVVVNVSVSGATTTNGLRALPKLLSRYPKPLVIIALGSNDGLRGIPITVIKSNIGKMITAVQQQGGRVLLVGFALPYNYGIQYRQQFADLFSGLAKEYDVRLVPFLLAGFAEDLSYFQRDQLHPTAAAQPLILDNIWPYLEPML